MNKLIRFGIWGTGAIAQQLAADFPLAEGAVLHAVGSRTLDRARAFAAAYGATKAYEGLDALLADADVDVVYIASPNHRHATESLLCIEAGKAVLCEKPFAVDEPEARRVVEAARERGVFCMEAMWTRFIPAIVEARRLIHAGEIGSVRLLQGNFSVAMADQSSSRFAAPALGGGALLDLGVYLVSLAQHLLGEPSRVKGLATLAASGADATSAIQLAWQAGAIADFSVSLCLNGTNEAMILGEKGRLRLPEPFFRPHRLEVKHYAATGAQTMSAGADQPIERSRLPPIAQLLRRRVSPAVAYLRRGSLRSLPFAGNGYQFQLLEVVRCLREGSAESAVMPLEDTLSVMRTMDAIRGQWTA